MNYATIKKYDIANGPGVRVSLFVSGCTHHCKGCFNQEAWDFAYGAPYTAETEDEIIEALRPWYITGLTLLGGEPFEPANQAALLPLLRRVRRELPEKTIWAFTGYTLETDLLTGKLGDWAITREILHSLDVLVDGEFILEQKDISLRFRGSANQRLIDLPKTLERDEVVLWDDGTM
ncbi:MAG TPA: anaerobic ribonucleoside-triphosphate reductase activating protein [Candidatus Onthomonas avicola]|nr:anaerobic ribonucleoside-triphosphate reductase activating protein [Candidatus Onthomonas avicola]